MRSFSCNNAYPPQRGDYMLTWELVGAVVGAGLASGREVASFFSRHGHWSVVGILLACFTLITLADPCFPSNWKHRWPEKLWRILLSLLLIATGGAMLSGAGEISALTLPIRGAYWFGMAGTLFLAWILAHRASAGLAWVSRILLCVLALLILLGFKLPAMPAATLHETTLLNALGCGLTYGGFNAALQASILTADGCSSADRRRHVKAGGMAIMLLLLLGNAVLMRHPALMGELMPFISMMRNYGKFGYFLGAACLYLAILSTLTACLRGLGRRVYAVLGIILIAMLGFDGVVEKAYPILGGACFLMLVVAKFTNSISGPFISRKDMV